VTKSSFCVCLTSVVCCKYFKLYLLFYLLLSFGCQYQLTASCVQKFLLRSWNNRATKNSYARYICINLIYRWKITTTPVIWYFGCRFSVLNYDSLQKADDIFGSDTAILKMSNCCQTICDFLHESFGFVACQRLAVAPSRGWLFLMLLISMEGESSQSCV